MTFVSELEPQPLWRHFDQILAIPRPSKGEEGMRRYVLATAERHGLESRRDRAGNVVVAKPGARGREGAPVTILQGHLDMVQEKNSDVAFDFAKDAIRPVRDGDYLSADGTTLGSDNGIGVAAMLALMGAEEVAHGPLELLFTVDEESGLTGAAQLAGDLLTGRRLLNLDSEEEGSVYVGCAGGVNVHLELPLASAPAGAGSTALSVKVGGFRGGHSGVDIHLQRGNAIQLLGRSLDAARRRGPLRLARFGGGSAHNAIPREASAVVVCADRDREAVADALQGEFAAIASELRAVDPGVRIEVERAPQPKADRINRPDQAWEAAASDRALALVLAIPHGVQAMSQDIPDLVETSANLATVIPRDGALELLVSVRSSVDSAKRALAREIEALAALAGARTARDGDYPGWKPNLASELLKTLQAVHRRELGAEPEVKAIHAGLETGIIGEKYPGMDMISFGPQIEFPHSPDERVLIPSVERFWRLLAATLAELA
jgi:dipeptidase D